MNLGISIATMAALPLGLAAAAHADPQKPPPSREQRAALQRKLITMGLPPGMAMLADQSSPVQQAVLAPVFHRPFVCSEHPQGQLPGLGDALGTDCMVVGGIDPSGSGFERPFRTDGRSNADWYGWRADVHAPINGVIRAVISNPVANTPGVMGRPPAGGIVIEGGDGLNVVIAHVTDPRVAVGERVTAGQVIAVDGNNGMARAPHVHVGAWRGEIALQIRWDSAAMGKVPELTGGGP